MVKKQLPPRLLGTAILCERRDELDPKPQGQYLVDFVTHEEPDVGIDRLAEAILVLTEARARDTFDPDVFGSSILWDVATFLAKVEEPAHVFLGPAKETALRVAGRLLRFEGWSTVAGYFATWQDAAGAVNPAEPRPDRIKKYVRLFRRYWEPNGAPFLDVFERFDED